MSDGSTNVLLSLLLLFSLFSVLPVSSFALCYPNPTLPPTGLGVLLLIPPVFDVPCTLSVLHLIVPIPCSDLLSFSPKSLSLAGTILRSPSFFPLICFSCFVGCNSLILGVIPLG